MPLLMANSAVGLGRRCYSCPGWRYLHHLRTVYTYMLLSYRIMHQACFKHAGKTQTTQHLVRSLPRLPRHLCTLSWPSGSTTATSFSPGTPERQLTTEVELFQEVYRVTRFVAVGGRLTAAVYKSRNDRIVVYQRNDALVSYFRGMASFRNVAVRNWSHVLLNRHLSLGN